MGQHLLINSGIAHAVAVAAEVKKNDRVLEIGPGTGMLTHELLTLGARVTAVEKDPAMVAALRERFAEEIKVKALRLIEGDARTVTPDSVFPKGAYRVAANIPYYITGELVRVCITAKNQPVALAFLVQKEVAERIARSTKESILSLSVKAYGEPHYVKTVSRGSFSPPPSVDSAILAIRGISRANIRGISEQKFFAVIKAAFAQKRKMLISNLSRFGTKERLLDAFARIDIDPRARAEDIPLKKWVELTGMLT